MDKRTSTRYAISLNALVHPNVGRSWLCQIQDFCDGGMLLVEQNGRPRRSLPGINQGEKVGIHFSVPTSGKDKHFRLEGQIVRVMDTGVGINFPKGMDKDALACLNDQPGLKPTETPGSQTGGGSPSDRSPSDKMKGSEENGPEKKSPATFLSGGLNPADAKKTVAMLRKEAARIIPEMTQAIFAYMDTELLELAKDAKSNAEQSEYFAAMSSLEKAKKQVSQDFSNEILNQFDEPRNLEELLEERKKESDARKAQSQKRVKLSLVNTEEFEDWLAIANTISRSERMYEKFLFELLQRMGLMIEAWKHKEANPLGPAVFTYAFDSAMHKVDLSKEIRQRVYTGYESKILPLFRKLYITTTKQMEDSGVFPDLDDDYVSTAQVDSSKKDEEVKKAEEVSAEPEEIEEELLEEEQPEKVEDEQEEERPPPSPRPGSSSRRRRQSDAVPERAGRRASDEREPSQPPEPRRQVRRASDVGEAIRNIYSSVRGLMGAKGGVAEQYGDDDEYFEMNEVQDLLSTLEEEMHAAGNGRMPVRQRLLETDSLVGGRRVAPATMQNLEVVENLVDTI